MRRSYFSVFAVTLACLFGARAEARAGFVNWSYNWSRVPADVVSADANGTSRLSLTDEPLGRGTNSSDIVATNIKAFSDTPRATPNTFRDAAYALTLRLTDDASGESGALTFQGVFNGTLSAASADVQTSFTSPTTQELVLGGNRYTVTLGEYSPPGPPGINNSGSISAQVAVTEGTAPPPPSDDPPLPPVENPPSPPNHAPEPSTVLLAGLGLSFLGTASWRRWRRAHPPAAATP